MGVAKFAGPFQLGNAVLYRTIMIDIELHAADWGGAGWEVGDSPRGNCTRRQESESKHCQISIFLLTASIKIINAHWFEKALVPLKIQSRANEQVLGNDYVKLCSRVYVALV